MVRDGHRNSTELYGRIATSYGIPLFAELADVIATTNVGVPEREAFTRLALSVYERRLSEARVRSARAKVLVTLPHSDGADFWLQASQTALDAVWKNSEDDVYGQLLQK